MTDIELLESYYREIMEIDLKMRSLVERAEYFHARCLELNNLAEKVLDRLEGDK